MKSPSAGPSILLRNIHCSLSALARHYEQGPSGQLDIPQVGGGTAPPSGARLKGTSSLSAFPADPQNADEGHRVLHFFCKELNMGSDALLQWRQRLQEMMERRWRLATPPHLKDSASLEQPWIKVAPSSRKSDLNRAGGPSRSSSAWLRPRQQDMQLIRSAVGQLKLVVSPLILLSPPPIYAAEAPGTGVQPNARPSSHEECSRWFATRPIPAGMILMSIPTEAALLADPPSTADPILRYFMQVEELAAQLVAAVAETSSPHHGYATYLCDSVVPSRNLPFLSENDISQLLDSGAGLPAEEGSVSSSLSSPPPRGEAPAQDSRTSPAQLLWTMFHEEMKGEPLSSYLRQRLGREEYAWWVSLVLSHRSGSTTLLPIVDKLNHSPAPNCHYTMSTESSFCGLDVVDNLVANVPLELLYQPYAHVFAMQNIAAGEELTLCYSSAQSGQYRPASHQMPKKPLSLLQSAPEVTSPSSDVGTTANAATAISSEDVGNAVSELFPDAALSEDAAPLHELQHSGKQEVMTPEGRARWQLQWGFIPPYDAVYSARDLEEVAAIVAERRLDTRQLLFPPTP